MTIRLRSAAASPRRRAPRRLAGTPHVERLEARDLMTTYAVGPGQAYGTLGSVPWSSVGAGDTVAIHWQAAGYHEKLLISGSGTAAQPINIVGIPGSQGQQPIIDGANATTSGQFHYSYSPQQRNSLVLIQRSADQAYDYKPSYINISGIEFKNAYQSNTFTDASGATQTYDPFAAAIYIQGSNNVTIKNDTLDNSGLGLFILSNGDEAHTSRDVMVDGNSIYGNGVPGQYLEHNVYSEAVGITYQYNDFGPLRAGSAGNNVKDRSAGAVFRYNYFAPGGHILDLVDPEDSNIAATDPSFTNTYVYGNVLDNTGPNGATFLVHFGGDSGNTSIYRPHLEFYDNTVVDVANQGATNGRYRTIMFQLDTNAQSVNAYNNVFYNGPATAGASATLFEWMNDSGVAEFGPNWASPGWLPSYDTKTFTGTISGMANLYSDPNNNPGFVDLAGGDYHPAAGSSVIGRGVAVAPGDPAVTMQYLAPNSGTSRPNVADFGAFASGITAVPTVVSNSPAAAATGVSTSASLTATFNVSIASGLSFVLDGPSGAVAAKVTYAEPGHVATLVPSAPLLPSTSYTATVSGAMDAAGTAMAAPYSWSFTTAAASTVDDSLWSTSVIPAFASANDPAAVELGVKFRSTISGSIIAVRFYKGAANTGTHVGHLWSANGTLLATASFTAESQSGWQQVNFSSPVAIAANTTYVASYYAPAGEYAYNSKYFSLPFSNAPLMAPANAGVYRYGSNGGFPTSTYNATNYWVDVVFRPASGSATAVRVANVATPDGLGALPPPKDASTSLLVPQVTSVDQPATWPEAGPPTGRAVISIRQRNGRRL